MPEIQGLVVSDWGSRIGGVRRISHIYATHPQKNIVKGKRKGDLLGHQTRLIRYGTLGKKIGVYSVQFCVTDEA